MADQLAAMRPPSGILTFLFTDVEDSTGGWEADEQAMELVLERHDRIIEEMIAGHGGFVFSTAGDSFAAAFDSARAAVEAAIAALRAVKETGLAVRMGLHAGEAHERGGDYFGPTVNRAARVMSVAHGGQVVVTSAVADLVEGRFELVDLGEHQLRGLRTAMRLWQVRAEGLTEQFPPLASAPAGRTNLVAPLSSLVGRDREVAALAAGLIAPCVVTVTGVGGIGKTRLALAAAAQVLARFPGGVWVAELAAVDDPDLVAEVVLATLGSRRTVGMSSVAALAELCATQQLLLVLDNCEHVLDAASAVAEAIVGAGSCAVLATSREPLGVAGERVWPVPSLSGMDAQALFVDRAAAAGATITTDGDGDAVIGEICRRLDGIPLAIELAAGRARSMTPTELLGRLDTRFRLLRGGPRRGLERHRTLHAALQWSYGLLSLAEQRTFRRLAVFAGGFTAEQASVVCAWDETDPADELEIIDVLDHLVARSMLNIDRSGAVTRYRLLESLRQFGEDALEAAGDSFAARARHAGYFLRFAEACRRRQSTTDAPGASAALTMEWDNVRAALAWFVASNEIDGALRLIISTWWHAFLTLRYELAAWADTAINLPGAKDDPRWPTATGAAGMFAWGAGELDQAISLAAEANTVAGDHGWPDSYEPHLAFACAASFRGDLAQAVTETDIAEGIAAHHRDPVETGPAGACRVVAMFSANPDASGREAAYQTAVRLVHSANPGGNPYELAMLYYGLLLASSVTGRPEEARAAYWLVRRYSEQIGNRWNLGGATFALAMVESEPIPALELLHEALTTFRGTDWSQQGNVIIGGLRILARLECSETVASAYAAWRRWYPHRVVGLADQDRPQLEHSLEASLGARLPDLYAQGTAWTRAELATAVLEEVDRVLANYTA
jgi:predicted ATPase/class 3 adenylate cyclase